MQTILLALAGLGALGLLALLANVFWAHSARGAGGDARELEARRQDAARRRAADELGAEPLPTQDEIDAWMRGED